jgi:hypothetical protein
MLNFSTTAYEPSINWKEIRMHPRGNGVIHERETGNRKIIVERVELRHTPIRIVYQQRPSHGSRFVTLNPDYEVDQEAAIEKANEWVSA